MPRTAAGTPAPWKRAHVQGSDGDSLLVQGRVAFKNFLRRRSLGQQTGIRVPLKTGVPRIISGSLTTTGPCLATVESTPRSLAGSRRARAERPRPPAVVDQLFFREQASNGCPGTCGPGRIRWLSIAL